MFSMPQPPLKLNRKQRRQAEADLRSAAWRRLKAKASKSVLRQMIAHNTQNAATEAELARYGDPRD